MLASLHHLVMRTCIISGVKQGIISPTIYYIVFGMKQKLLSSTW